MKGVWVTKLDALIKRTKPGRVMTGPQKRFVTRWNPGPPSFTRGVCEPLVLTSRKKGSCEG